MKFSLVSYVRQGYGHWLSFQDRVLKEMILFFIPMEIEPHHTPTYNIPRSN